MIHAPIIPDRQILRVLPSVPHLEIMIISDQIHEPPKRLLAFEIAKSIDRLHMMSNGENGFPASDGVCANYRVLGF